MSSPGEDRAERENSRMAIGQTLAGRYLRIIYALDSDPGGIFVITAYELRGAPLAAYRRRMRRRQR